jgi:hypothetical protein
MPTGTRTLPANISRSIELSNQSVRLNPHNCLVGTFMNKLIPILSFLLLAPAFATDQATQSPAPPLKNSVHRYLIERTFPAGALKGLDASTKKKVNANNASVGVRWVESYANADETKTFCVYEGPSEAAVRKAAELNKLPVDSITEVPVTLSPK